jgi:hypothetical protein
MNTYEKTIKTNKRIGTIIFLMVCLLFTLGKIFNTEVFEGMELFLTAIGIFVFFYLIWMITGEVVFIMTKDELIVKRKIFRFILKRDLYSVHEISNIEKQMKTNADSYWRVGFLKFMDKNPIAILFDYSGTKVKIGEGLEGFNADEFIREIKKRKK